MNWINQLKESQLTLFFIRNSTILYHLRLIEHGQFYQHILNELIVDMEAIFVNESIQQFYELFGVIGFPQLGITVLFQFTF